MPFMSNPTDVSGIEKKLDKIQDSLPRAKWWENNWVQIPGILGAVASILALILVFVPPASGISKLWPWFALGAVILFAVATFKIFSAKKPKALIFIPDEIQSMWHHAPQPDGRKLTQIALKGHVTNTSNQPLFLPNIHLVSPHTKRTHQKLIFTIHNNVVDSENRPIMPKEMTVFDTHFFAEGFLGKPKKPLTIVVSIIDNFGRRYKVKFPKIREATDR